MNLNLLPKLPITHRRILPKCSAVYFVLGLQGKVLYVGRAKCLRERWRSHHHLFDDTAQIAWVETSPDLLVETEKQYIEQFNPALNTARGKGRTVNVLLYGYDYRRLREIASIWGISLAATIRKLIHLEFEQSST